MKALLVVVAIALPATASAQFNPAAQASAEQRMTESFALRGTAESRMSRSYSNDGYQCLRDKRTNRKVCHTRLEWEQIAAQLGRAAKN